MDYDIAPLSWVSIDAYGVMYARTQLGDVMLRPRKAILPNGEFPPEGRPLLPRQLVVGESIAYVLQDECTDGRLRAKAWMPVKW